jgi:hypothetical protein
MRRWFVVLISTALVAVLFWTWWADDAEAPASQTAGSAASSDPSDKARQGFDALWSNTPRDINPLSPLTPQAQLQREQRLIALRERYERAEQTYNTYRDATRYPHESRPIADHADRNRPFDPAIEDKTMRNERGEPVKSVKIRTGQSHVFLSGSDAAKLTIQAFDERGNVIALNIARAAAQNVPDSKQLIPVRSAPLEFTDLGPQASNGIDDAAADGQFSARFSPLAQGFTGNVGTIRILVFYRANGQDGVAHFDLVYTEDTAATWVEGGIREVVENGSLSYYVKANIKTAGRYVVSSRVDDAHGNPFALISFNDELAAGTREFKLVLFGALIRDKRPAFPLRLRDMEGFLLIPDKFPDRLMMERRPGTIHTGQQHRLENFSDAEWSSEERDRHLAEYGKDLDAAKRALMDASSR